MILQFILASLSVGVAELANENYLLFREADGLRIIFICLSQCYKELKPINLKSLDPLMIEDQYDFFDLKKVGQPLRRENEMKNYTEYLGKVNYFE